MDIKSDYELLWVLQVELSVEWSGRMGKIYIDDIVLFQGNSSPFHGKLIFHIN